MLVAGLLVIISAGFAELTVPADSSFSERILGPEYQCKDLGYREKYEALKKEKIENRIEREKAERTRGGKKAVVEEPLQGIATPFRVCRGKTKELRVDTPEWREQAPQLYSILQDFVIGGSEYNVEEAKAWSNCISSKGKIRKREGCAELESFWTNSGKPKSSPLEACPILDKGASFPVILKVARCHLSLAHTAEPSDKVFSLNRELKPYGSKAKAWDPLTREENKEFSSLLQQYLSNMKNKLGLSDKQISSLTKPNAKVSLFSGNKAASPCDQSLRSIAAPYLAQTRQRHLDIYLALVADYPVINYISSAEPSLAEIKSASEHILSNGLGELRSLKKNEEYSKKHPERIRRHANDLLEYKAYVEYILDNKPELCSVATAEYKRKDLIRKRQMQFITYPTLAISIVAPPVAPYVLGAVAIGTRYHKWRKVKATERAAYSAITGGSLLKAKQGSVDALRKSYYGDLVMIPFSMLGL